MNTQTERRPYPYSNCTCERVYVEPNADIDTPAFPGIVRFGHWKITDYNRECLNHGYMYHINLAADLRYGD